MYPLGPAWGLWDCGYNNGNPQPCVIVGNYGLRPDAKEDISYPSYKLDKMTGKGIASDLIWGWMYYTIERQDWAPVPWNTPEMLTRRHYKENHDMAYNILFTDGAVKTYSDSGGALMTEIRNRQIERDGLIPENTYYSKWWELYFDAQYAQN